MNLSSPDPTPHPSLDDLYLPIALRKGTRVCTHHPISHFISYDQLSLSLSLSLSLCAFSLSIAFKPIPRSHVEAAQVLASKMTMDSEVEALVSQGIWKFFPCLEGANIIIYKVGLHPQISS